MRFNGWISAEISVVFWPGMRAFELVKWRKKWRERKKVKVLIWTVRTSWYRRSNPQQSYLLCYHTDVGWGLRVTLCLQTAAGMLWSLHLGEAIRIIAVVCRVICPKTKDIGIVFGKKKLYYSCMGDTNLFLSWLHEEHHRYLKPWFHLHSDCQVKESVHNSASSERQISIY